MITRIEASRYRCFERLALDVSRYQVLVGRNGAGKSTLIEFRFCWVKYLKLEASRSLFLATEEDSRRGHLRSWIWCSPEREIGFRSLSKFVYQNLWLPNLSGRISSI